MRPGLSQVPYPTCLHGAAPAVGRRLYPAPWSEYPDTAESRQKETEQTSCRAGTPVSKTGLWGLLRHSESPHTAHLHGLQAPLG